MTMSKPTQIIPRSIASTKENDGRSSPLVKLTLNRNLILSCLGAASLFIATVLNNRNMIVSSESLGLDDREYIFSPGTPSIERLLSHGETFELKDAPIGLGRSTVFLLGIFSTTSEKELERRNLIRGTYLATNDDRVCKLSEYLKQVEESRTQIQTCHIPYAFIIGANPDGPLELDDSQSMTVDPSTIVDLEDDVVYLNIKENMENGKSISYFKYASSLSNLYGIDYVAKTDSDTMIKMEALYRMLEDELPPKPYNRRMYGGSSWANYETSGVYAAGQFYFMSDDVANYVSNTLTQEQRKALTSSRPTEDLDMGTFVFSHPRPIKFIFCTPYQFWKHPVKSKEEWLQVWNSEYEMSRLPYRGKLLPYWHLCPTWKNMKLY